MDGAVERATHGFHTYPARMHPDAAQALIAACQERYTIPSAEGTVVLEGLLAGRQTTGTDLSPIRHPREWCTHRRSRAGLADAQRGPKITEAARLRVDVEVPELAERWFRPHVAQELGRIRDGIAEAKPEVQPLLRALLSGIIIKCSYRKSDTQNRRETRDTGDDSHPLPLQEGP